MRIAQVAPLFESVPPVGYGGTERVVSYLTEALVQEGHDVTLFASGDSITRAHLVACCPRALRAGCIDPLAHQVRQLDLVFAAAREFDLIHYHIDYLHYPFSRHIGTPHLTTLHGRLDLPDLVPLYQRFRDVPVVSISNAQRQPLPWINWRATVYHGLPRQLYTFHEAPGNYLAFLGRISPEKRADRAIAIAKAVGMPLRIAAKVDPVDREYYAAQIAPLLDDPSVEYLGELGEAEKDDFLGNAAALLFPIDWPEPFGLAMIEAMACGTPVIAFAGGSVREIVQQGVNGFVVDDLQGAAAAVSRVATLSRRACRETFERRFSDVVMGRKYLGLYDTLRSTSPRGAAAMPFVLLPDGDSSPTRVPQRKGVR
jgi:glycosyltransferase involved in cell wall biosynthesis